MDTPRHPMALVSAFQRTGEVARWGVPEALRRSPAVVFRDNAADAIARLPVDEIIRSQMHATIPQVDRLLALARRHAFTAPLTGVGLELGAGTGLVAALVARQARVRAVLALEVCPRMAERIIPQVAAGVLGARAGKVVPVVGSFDDLRLPDASLDFAVEKDSFHHSDGLARTVAECARVLRPGGWLVCFDRCHPDTVTDDAVRRMLARVYSRRFLVAHGYPPDAVLTRRDNGEHEYRLFEWEHAFRGAGLDLVRMAEMYSPQPWDIAVAGLMAALPRGVRPVHRRAPGASVRSFVLWLAQHAGLHTIGGRPLRILRAPERTTLFVLRKL